MLVDIGQQAVTAREVVHARGREARVQAHLALLSSDGTTTETDQVKVLTQRFGAPQSLEKGVKVLVALPDANKEQVGLGQVHRKVLSRRAVVHTVVHSEGLGFELRVDVDQVVPRVFRDAYDGVGTLEGLQF